MAGLCKVTIVGNLGRDPEKKYTGDGRPVTRFSVAATTRRKERDGEWADHTEWFSVTVFGQRAETLATMIGRGSRVYVEGRLESRKYDTQNGGQGFSLDVIANEVILLDGRKADDGEDQYERASAPAGATQGRPRNVATNDAADLDDLPF